MSITAMKLALEALENPWKAKPEGIADAITTLRQAIEQAEQEPTSADYAMGYCEGFNDACKPSQRQWVGLTSQELNEVTNGLEDLEDCYIAIEAKLKEKNT